MKESVKHNTMVMPNPQTLPDAGVRSLYSTSYLLPVYFLYTISFPRYIHIATMTIFLATHPVQARDVTYIDVYCSTICSCGQTSSSKAVQMNRKLNQRTFETHNEILQMYQNSY